MAKYLSPPQPDSSKTRKRMIKRPYGVSVTDLDVLGEDIIKKKKKNSKVVQKKVINNDDGPPSKTKSKKNKLISNTTTIPSTSDNSPTFYMAKNYSQQSTNYPPTSSYYPSSNNLQNPSYQTYSQQITSPTLQQLHNASTTNSSTCARCYQQFNTLNLGGHCLQCHAILCWLCCSSEPYTIYYCNNCRSMNYNNSQ